MDRSNLKGLEDLYHRYNKRDLVHPDPLEFLYNYQQVQDREIVALIAASLAYGRVKQILKSVSLVLARIGNPTSFLETAGLGQLQDSLAHIRHRFTTGNDLALLLFGIKRALESHGSLENLFIKGLSPSEKTLSQALSRFVQALLALSGQERNFLLPDPARGSACKRGFLFLRWMIRHDEVDPGGWTSIPRSKLVVPLDTHMFHICKTLGLTAKRQANLRAALEITERFRKICPSDPVKYDFALTRFGIRPDLERSSIPSLLSVDQ